MVVFKSRLAAKMSLKEYLVLGEGDNSRKNLVIGEVNFVIGMQMCMNSLRKGRCLQYFSPLSEE